MKSHHIRFTISVEPEVHEAFSEMAALSGSSLSSTVGAWLKDTTEAARFVNQRMRELRESPAAAMFELARVQEGAAAETRKRAADIASGKVRVVEKGAGTALPRRRAAEPPSSPTGVNLPGRRKAA